jgi:hypothetical protein
MNNKVKPEKYRNLSIAALVTGILTFGNVPLFIFLGPFIGSYFQNFIPEEFIAISIVSFLVIYLPIPAIVCGSIDLKRIKVGKYSNKGIGMDIAGIVLGSVFILIAVWLLLGEILVPL